MRDTGERKQAMVMILGLLFFSDFLSPSPPPRAEYHIQVKLDLDRNVITGTQSVRMKNTARRPLRQIALSWNPTPGRALECEFEGRKLEAVGEKSPLLFELPRDWKEGESVELRLRFSQPGGRPKDGRPAILTAWHPKV